MIAWPDLGTRVTLRYRLPPASVPPLTDAIGHLLSVDPMVRVQTKTGAIVEVSPTDVVALRTLTDKPVRTADIRNLEHAAASAWPGAEQYWLEGWLLRTGPAPDAVTNSAVPLDISAQWQTVPAIIDWYRSRGLTPRLALPDRLLTPPRGLEFEHTEQILVRDVAPCVPDSSTIETDSDRASVGGVRAAVTAAPDGTHWVGISAAGQECETLLAWGASRGVTRAYLCVPDTDSTSPAALLGFRFHHRRRYVLPTSA